MTDIVGTASQGNAFFSLFVSGVLCALLYTFETLLRKKTKSKVLSAVIDAFFVLLSGAAMLYTATVYDGGRIRLYTFFSFLTGFTAERSTQKLILRVRFSVKRKKKA